jgi:hypothetical protein
MEFEQSQESSIFHVVHTGFGAYLTSYPMGTGVAFPGGKAAGAWSWSFTSNKYRGQENVDLSPYALMAYCFIN